VGPKGIIVTTATDLSQIEQDISTLATDYQADQATQSAMLAQLTATQSQLSTAQANLLADVTTIAGLQAKIIQLQGSQAPLSAFPTLAWHDEFDGTAVDGSKWHVDDGVAAHNERAYRLARNVTIQDGNLVIQPKLESAGGRLYTSGSINCSYVPQRPFYVETRVFLPLELGRSAGMWSAPLWLRGLNGAGEIDGEETFEIGAGATAGAIAEQPHAKQTCHIYSDTNTGAGKAGKLDSVLEDASVYHTIGVEVDADGSVTVYRDGAIFDKFPVSQYPYLGTAFAGGYRIISTLQIGSTYYGIPDGNTDWTQNMRHDYFRIWTP
jgi:beta-glucanase (GH16 family)